MSDRKIVTAKKMVADKPVYTMWTLASELPSNTRAYESYKKFMTGFRGDDAKRMRKYISQTARATDPLEGETLGNYIERIGTIVKTRFDGPKSMSMSPASRKASPAAAPAPAAPEKKQKRKLKTPSAERKMSASPNERPKVRAKAPSADPMADMLKLFETMNMTKTTKKNVILARPVVRTSRQSAVAAAKADEKKKHAEEARRLKELAEKRRTARKERKQLKTDTENLVDMFNIKLAGGSKKH